MHGMKRGRQAGSINYRNDIVLDVVADVFPMGSNDWKRVADLYMEKSGEQVVRQWNDINLCLLFGLKICQKPILRPIFGSFFLDRNMTVFFDLCTFGLEFYNSKKITAGCVCFPEK